ncbi:uncharacterized protein LOC134836170 isoform X5 [Culicoides brevitarsis]|uniref:uncharacterized protein LOC134836170 isoform X5 n=1 Tax=Culicoides brevitarsis TaxID=469753 RepID=UPI00307C19FB
MNEYEQHGALTDEKREDLSQLVSEFMAKGVVKGGRAGHEAIAEATLILFPGTFEDDPKTLAEALYNRLSRQTQQRYGTESPEVPRIKHEKSDFPIQNKYLLAASALQVRDLDALMTRMQLELRGLCEKWIDDVIEGLGSDALSKVTDFQPRIVVDVDDAGKLYSSVECFLCRKDIRVGFKKCRSALGLKCNFIRGNFDRHFNVHHNIKN